MRDLIDKWMFLTALILGKTGECTRADCKGAFFIASKHCWFLRAHLRRGRVTFPEAVKHLHRELQAESKLLVISSVTLRIIRKEAVIICSS